MKYEIWAGSVILGYSELDFPQMSPITYVGTFVVAPNQAHTVERLAIRLQCMSAWMNRDICDESGAYLIGSAMRNCRLFALITKTVESQRGPSLQLRLPDGMVIPTRQLLIQHMQTLTEHPELVEEALRAAADEAYEEQLAPSPFDSPEGRELYRELQAEGDEEMWTDAWRGDGNAQASDVDGEWDLGAFPVERPSRFHVHVRIEYEGDIPADTSGWW